MKSNQVEITVRYTGDKPQEAINLVRKGMTYKGWKFENIDQDIPFEEKNGEYIAVFTGTNAMFLGEPVEPKAVTGGTNAVV